jgi:hypothetical protein
MKYSTSRDFPFGPNYNMGQNDIYSSENTTYSAVIPPPPDEGYFLELNGTPFLLLNGEDMTLL